MKRVIIIEIIAYLFIILFVYTSLSKLLMFDIYVYDLNRSPLLGWASPVLKFLIPGSELIISAMLFFDRTKLMGLYGSLVLMIVFTLYVGYIISFETNLPCTCGGIIRELDWREHFVFNLFFTCLAVFAIWLYKKDQFDKHNTNPKITLVQE